MKKKVLGSMLLAATVVSTLVFAKPVDAADVHNVDSDAVLKFVEGSTPVDPLDPDTPDLKPINPEKPIDPTKPENQGPLKFNYVPYLNFGENKISALKQDIHAKFVHDTVATGQQYTNFVQVTDMRGTTKGKTGGWVVTANFDGKFKTETGSHEIAGTKITFVPSVVKSKSDITDKAKFPSKQEKVEIGNNTAAELGRAEGAKTQGYGTWQFLFGSYIDDATEGLTNTKVKPNTGSDDPSDIRNSAVTLTVPAGQMIEKQVEYQATVNWVLSDAA